MRRAVFRGSVTGAVATSVLTLIGLLAGGSASGDALVLRDGSRLEIRGELEERGRTVVFRLANGTLSSLPAADVDLEATHRANREEVETPVTEEDVAPPVARLVLTDRDIPRAAFRPASVDAEGGEEGEEAGDGAATRGSTASPVASSLRVIDYVSEDVVGGSGLVFAGTLQNSSESAFGSIALGVRVFDDTGKVIAEGEAFLDSPILEGGGKTSFRVPFPDIWTFERVEFDVAGTEYLIGVASDSVGTLGEESP